MVHKERRAIISLAIIMACRMLGLFMILPFFSVYATHLAYATPTLIGIALVAYGLTQACLQIPFGALSDRWGRKKVITIGLLIFAVGSMVAALSHSIYGIILGRALQGAGAMGSTLLAMAADLSRDENRSKAMAILGLTIGFSFFIAIIIGPVIHQWLHLSGIFWTIFALALIALLVLHTVVPNPPPLFINTTTEYQRHQLVDVLKNNALLRLNVGIFTLHAMLTATFLAVPVLLTQNLNLSQHHQIFLYLNVMLICFVLMFPLIIVAEKKRQLRRVFLAAILTLILTELLLAHFQHSLILIELSLLGFFTAFSILEACLPSIVSKIAPIKRKGTAMGIYSTFQFLGIFMGGTLGGVIFGHFHLVGLFLFCAILGTLWLWIASTMSEPPYLSTYIFQLKSHQLHQLHLHLTELQGVSEVAVMPNENLIYVKADNKIISKDQLRKCIDESNLRQ